MTQPRDDYVPEWSLNRTLGLIREKQDARAGLATAQAEMVQARQQVEPAPKPEPNILERAFSLINRPQQAAFQLMPGGGGLPAAGQALLGGLGPIPAPPPPRRFEEVLTSMRTPELGKESITPWGITGRGALGLAGDIGLDPLNLLAKGGTGVARGAGLAAGTARPLIEGVTVAGKAAELAQPTVLAQAAQAASRLPVVGKGLAATMDRISPGILAGPDPVRQNLVAFMAAEDSSSSRIAAMLAPLNRHPFLSQVAQDGRVTLANGQRIAWGDLRDPQFRPALMPEQRDFVDRMSSLVDDMERHYDEAWDRLNIVSPATAKAFERKKLADYLPRYTAGQKGPQNIEFTGPTFGQKTHLFERPFPTMHAGLEAGQEYLGPLDTLARAIRDFRSEANQMDFAAIMANSVARAGGARGARTAESALRPLKGLWWQPEDLARTEAFLTRTAPDMLRQINTASGFSRSLLTTADLSAPFIQGIPWLTTHPVQFLKDFAASAREFASPGAHQAWLASPFAQGIVARAPGIALSAGKREYFSGAPQVAGALSRIPKVGGVLSGVIERSGAAFDAFGDRARIHWMDAMLPQVERLPAAQRSTQLARVTAMVNHATGSASTTAMGLSPTQRGMEQALLFAPMYYRSALALMGDMAAGGLTTQQAMKTMGSLAVVGPLIYQKIAQLTGQEPVWDPTDSRFMTVDVAGQRIGPGSVWRALVSALGNTTINRDTGQVDPSNLWRSFLEQEDVRDKFNENPLFRFWRGRASPVAGSTLDVAMGEDISGEPLSTPPDLAKYVGTRLLPIAAQSVIFAEGPRTAEGTVASGVANVMGLRQFPEKHQDVQDRQAREEFGLPYRELTPSQKAEVEGQIAGTGRELPQGRKFAPQRERQAAAERERTALNILAERLDKGEINRQMFRKQAQDLAERLGAVLEDIEVRHGEGKPSQDSREQARQQYLEMIRDTSRGDQRFEDAEAFLSAQPAGVQAYVADAQRARAIRVGGRAGALMLELLSDRQKLKPYWDITDMAMARFGIDPSTMNPAQFAALQQAPRWRPVQRLITQRKELLRRQQPEIDAALYKWGYVSALETPRGRPFLPPEMAKSARIKR